MEQAVRQALSKATDNNPPCKQCIIDVTENKETIGCEMLIWRFKRGIRNDVRGNTVKTTKRGISAQSKETAVIMARSTRVVERGTE
jgi:hypothetical protein